MASSSSAMAAAPGLGLPQLLAPLNRLLTPGLRCGFANPLPLTSGLILLEVAGRKSGKLRAVPLVCADYGAMLAVSTVRDNSQWLKNLTASPAAHVWLRGRRRPVTAQVYQRGMRLTGDAEPERIESGVARTLSRATGVSIVLLALTDLKRSA